MYDLIIPFDVSVATLKNNVRLSKWLNSYPASFKTDIFDGCIAIIISPPVGLSS